MRDAVLLLGWLVVVVAVGLTAGRWAALAVLLVVILVRAVRLATTGTTSSLRWARVRIVRSGTGARREPWRLVLYQLGPALLFGPLFVVTVVAPVAFPLAIAGSVAIWIAGARRAR